MKYLSLLFLLVAIQLPAQSFKEVELKTRIEGATVFLQGAQITRSGKIKLKAGKNHIRVKSLSPHVVEKSVQVKGSGNFTVLSVRHSLDYLDQEERDAKTDSLWQLIESLELEINTLKNRNAILQEKVSLLDRNKEIGGTGATTTSQLKQAMEFYDQALMTIKKEELENSLKITALTKEKVKIQKQVSDVNQNDDLPSGVIEIRTGAAAATDAEFTITYLVANAGWYPNYDIRVNSVNEPLTLKYKAEVYQNTGIDWQDIKLKFSNGDPNQSGVAPELSTWYLNYPRNTIYTRAERGLIDRSVRNVKGRVISGQDGSPLPGANVVVKGSTVGTVTNIDGEYELTLPNNAEQLVFSFVGFVPEERIISGSRVDVSLEADVAQLSEVVVTGYSPKKLQGRTPGVMIRGVSSMADAEAISTTAVENQTTVEFEVDIPYSLKSNGSSLSIDLTQHQIETLYEYHAVPKLDKDAFLIARIINWDQYNLLEGEANLYFEDAYVGKSVLDARSLSDTLDLSLGRDKNLVIGRTRISEYSRSRTIGANKVESRGFSIIARNKKSEPIRLIISDQIPVAAISDITISPTELSGGKLEEETGIVTWEIDLQSQQQEELEFKYEVKYPKKEKLVLE